MFNLLLVSNIVFRTASRKNYASLETFIAEPDSRAQCMALEDNVKEFGLTYFSMTDRRQGSYHAGSTLLRTNEHCRNRPYYWT